MSPRIRKFERDPEVNRRVKIVYFLSTILFFVLLARLYYLQVIQFSAFYAQSEENRVRLKPVRAPRGLILDRNGVVLADSKPVFHLVVIPYDVVDVEGELSFLGTILELDLEETGERILSAKNENPLGSINIISDLTFDQVSIIETNMEQVPGFSISFDPRRNYPFGSLISHVLGYVSEADLDDLKRYKEKGVIFGDYVGKMGVERASEGKIHGRDGIRRLEVDALGREKKELSYEKPKQGENIRLSLDIRLQEEAARLLKGRVGAIFGMNPETGDVYVAYSSPSFDPNMFARGIRNREWKRLMRNNKKPLQNRLTQGIYAPGSTIKPILALGALQDGLMSEETKFYCGGEFLLGKSRFRCWKRGGHGDVNMKKALVESCDVYFYNLGLTAGVNNIRRWVSLFGLNEKTGIDIPSEAVGIVPGREGKRKRFKERWYDGDTVVSSIGQGYFAVTPVEMAVAYSTIANGGKVVSPRIIKGESSRPSDGKGEAGIVRRTLDLEKSYVGFLRNALEKAVMGEHGTGGRARISGVSIAGKTGTAQVVALPDEKIPDEELKYLERDHAWFVGFAPSADPQICVAVIIEHGGSGGKAAAPVFKEIVDKYLSLRSGR